MSAKTPNQKAWWLVLPVVLLVAFNAVIPLMAVVNYSVQETFGNNQFFFEGVRWFTQVMQSERFRESLQRQVLFTAIVLFIQVPLGVAIALAMPRKGLGVSICLVLMAMPLLIPYNVVGAMWNIFALPDIGLMGRGLNALGWDFNYTRQPLTAWFTVVLMDVWHWTSLVVLLVAFNAVIPLMAVVNYSVQETFGNNRFFFEGVKWFDEVVRSPASTGRSDGSSCSPPSSS